MFNDMRSEVRNLLLVASELGGAATQYVRVLRAEKERLLPIDAIQTEMEELKAQAEQASAAEANMFKALMKANDRTSVVEKNAASCKGLLEQANADTCKARAAEANMLRSLKMANDNTYETQEEARELKRKLEQAQKHIDTLQVTNDEYKEQLTKQAEELELMQANRVHAEVYQNVAAERDRALAELRTTEQAFQKELNKQHADLCACQLALVREQACRAELAKELQGCIADERANLATTRKELGEAMKLIEVLKGQVEEAKCASDCYNEQLAEWYKWLKEASKEAGVSGVARNFYDRDSLMEAIRSLRKGPSAVSLALKKAKDKLFRVAVALDVPVRSSAFIDYPGAELVDLYRKVYETHGGGTIDVSHDDCRRAAVLAVAAHVRKERCLVAQAVGTNVDIRVCEDDGGGFMVGVHAPGCDEELTRYVPPADVPATLARLLGEVSRG